MTGGEDEPNLVPLLDLVLQLVMFFMACTSFAKENLSEAVKLPVAQAAKAIEEEDPAKKREKIYLNVEDNGDVRVRSFVDENGTVWYAKGRLDDIVTNEAGNPVLGPDGKPQRDARLRRERVDKYLQRVYDSRSKRVKRDLDKPPANDQELKAKVAERTLVVLRAHENTDYKDVYAILSKCQQVGLTKMTIRAMSAK